MDDSSAIDGRMSRRQSPEVRKADILAAALEEFAAHGFSEARMEDVARRARVSKGTIYLYYPTKQAVFEALVRRDLSPRIAFITQILGGYDGPLEPLLMNGVGWVANLIETDQVPLYPKLILSEGLKFPDLLEFYHDAVIAKVLKAIAGLLSRAIARGDIVCDDPDIAAHLLIAPVFKSLLWHQAFGNLESAYFPVRPYLEHHVRTFLRGLRP